MFECYKLYQNIIQSYLLESPSPHLYFKFLFQSKIAKYLDLLDLIKFVQISIVWLITYLPWNI